MTSKIVVNNIEADSGINTVTFGSDISGNFVGNVNTTGVSTFSSGIVVAAGSTAAPSISPSEDSNTGIFFPEPDTVAIGEGGVEVIRVTSSGYVGINTNNPQKLIEVGAANTTSKFQLSPHGTGWDIVATSGNIAPHYQTNLSLFTGQIGSGTLRWQINNSGQVVVPFQPSFRAGRSSNYNPGANTDIIFNTTANTFHHNTGGHYSTSNGRFTCPIAGKYYFTACIIWGGGLSNQNLIDAAYIYVNGSNACYSFRRAVFVSGTTGGTDGYYTDHLNCILNLNVGDYVTIRNNYNIQVHGNQLYCWFAGHLLG